MGLLYLSLGAARKKDESWHASETVISFLDEGHLTLPNPKGISSSGSYSKQSGLAPNHGVSVFINSPHCEQAVTDFLSDLSCSKYIAIATCSFVLPHKHDSGILDRFGAI